MAANTGARPQRSPLRKDARATITPLLEPGETLLWYANGRGPHWTSQNTLGLLFVGVVCPALAVFQILSLLSGKSSEWTLALGLGMTVVVAATLAYGLIHAIFSPSRDCYGLTERRVIVVWRSWPGRTRSYSASNISALRLRDGKTGDITFWTQPARFVNRAWAIVGIDEPRRIADFIKATLRLDLPIEDLNANLRIPPLAPRNP